MTTPKLKPLPRARAKTALGLVQFVRRVILAEPKRVDMSIVAVKLPPDLGGPACGWVGCLAGWIALSAGYKDMPSGRHLIRAQQLLGPRIKYCILDDSLGNNHVFNGGGGDACAGTDSQTSEHAEAVASRIDHFVKVNGAQLRRNKLRIGARGRLIPVRQA